MNNLFQENKRSFYILLTLFFVLIALIYFLFFLPKVEERKTAVTQQNTLESEVAQLQAQLDNLDEGEEIAESDFENIQLQKAIPLEPELETFLLSLQEIELVTEVNLQNYSFSYDGSIPERQAILVDSDEESSEEAEPEVTEIEGTNIVVEEMEVDLESDGSGTNVIELPGMPENIQIVTVSMDVYAPDYEHLQAFLQEVEKQERVMMISYLSFTQPGESELLEADDESINTSIQISTFYYEQ